MNKFNTSGNITLKIPGHNMLEANRTFNQTSNCIKAHYEWDDGFFIDFKQTPDKIDVKSSGIVTKSNDNTYVIE